MSTRAEAWNPETLGQRLMMLRIKTGWSQETVSRKAREIGAFLDGPALSKVENDQRKPTLPQAIALARIYGIEPNQLGLRRSDFDEAAFWMEEENRSVLQQMGWTVEPPRNQPLLTAVAT
jgi:transcriptional regulator with XRE-family HTH domain